MNDEYLRELLGIAERPELVNRLGNILALPYGAWPTKVLARQALLGYTTPEGLPLQAIIIEFA